MKIVKVNSYDQMSNKTFRIIADQIKKNPKSRIGFATGSTPKGLYRKMVKSKLDFSTITTFNLDEYYPIKKNSYHSYDFFMWKNLFSKINIDVNKINSLNGEAKNASHECRKYDKKIGKLDIQILGLGINGHIGFNEPGSKQTSRTRKVKLSDETKKINSKKNFRVPKHALTMGIRNIMNAKKIIILANGRDKSKAVCHLINESINEEFPASVLKKHENCILIVERNAASLL